MAGRGSKETEGHRGLGLLALSVVGGAGSVGADGDVLNGGNVPVDEVEVFDTHISPRDLDGVEWNVEHVLVLPEVAAAVESALAGAEGL